MAHAVVHQNPITEAALCCNEVSKGVRFAVCELERGRLSEGTFVGPPVRQGIFTGSPVYADAGVDAGYSAPVRFSDESEGMLNLTWAGICPNGQGVFGTQFTIQLDGDDSFG